jgi:hypothetical protein
VQGAPQPSHPAKSTAELLQAASRQKPVPQSSSAASTHARPPNRPTQSAAGSTEGGKVQPVDCNCSLRKPAGRKEAQRQDKQ